MNVNEIIANRALIITGHLPGEYALIDPVEQANIFQSTNDVIPTSLRIALFRLFRHAGRINQQAAFRHGRTGKKQPAE